MARPCAAAPATTPPRPRSAGGRRATCSPAAIPVTAHAGRVAGERRDEPVAPPPVGEPGAADLPVVGAARRELGEGELVEGAGAGARRAPSRRPPRRAARRAATSQPSRSPGARLLLAVPGVDDVLGRERLHRARPAGGRSGTRRRSRPRSRAPPLRPAHPTARRAAPGRARRRAGTGAPGVSSAASAPPSASTHGAARRRPAAAAARGRCGRDDRAVEPVAVRLDGDGRARRGRAARGAEQRRGPARSRSRRRSAPAVTRTPRARAR